MLSPAGVSAPLAPTSAMSLTDFESPAWPVCTLSYRTFHLQWTLPLCLALYLLNRPFLTKLDYAKLTLLPAIAFVWTTPWDNVIVKNHAWFYRRHCVWFTVGYVPIEEYFFFVIQSIMTTLWCSFVTRWRLPNLYISRLPSTKPRVALSNVAVVTATALFTAGLWISRPSSHSYYFGMIVWWASVPLGLLTWGAIDFIAAMGFWAGSLPFVISVMAPSVYLWCSDIYALRRGTWHINERTSLNVFPIPDLPVEEMLFFVVTNTILVTACFTFDRCAAICRSKTAGTALSPSFLPLNTFTTYKNLWLAFIRSDYAPSDEALQARDIRTSLRVLSKASKSFSAASLLLPWDLRTDLGCLYAFCRVADDLVDDEGLALSVKKSNLQTVHAVIDCVYETGSIQSVHKRVKHTLAQSSIDPQTQSSVLASASSIAPLTRYIPKRLWLEMLSGYSTDLDFQHPETAKRTRFASMADLVEYSQCVAGVVGEMCTRVILGRCGVHINAGLEVDRKIQVPLGTKDCIEEKTVTNALDLSNDEDLHTLLYEARRMGVSLQLVNIARDIITDAVELGRCYLPLEIFAADEVDLQTALLEKRVVLPSDSESKGVRPEQVRKYALQLLDVSRELYQQSFPALGHIPNRPARAGLRAACSVYAAIGIRIQSQSASEVSSGKRARMSPLDRLARALAAVYLGS